MHISKENKTNFFQTKNLSDGLWKYWAACKAAGQEDRRLGLEEKAQ